MTQEINYIDLTWGDSIFVKEAKLSKIQQGYFLSLPEMSIDTALLTHAMILLSAAGVLKPTKRLRFTSKMKNSVVSYFLTKSLVQKDQGTFQTQLDKKKSHTLYGFHCGFPHIFLFLFLCEPHRWQILGGHYIHIQDLAQR